MLRSYYADWYMSSHIFLGYGKLDNITVLYLRTSD